MKHFWKKTNRGLWLGGALLLVTLIVIVVTALIFSVEKPLIRETVKDYVNDLIALNCAPQDAALGKKLSEADRRAKEAELEALLKNYWDLEDDTLVNGITGEEMRMAYASLLGDALRTRILEGEVRLSDRDIYISRQGPGYASVSLYVDTLSVTYEGAANGIFIGEEIFSDDEIKQDRYIGSYSLELTLEMHRVGGEWRIISCYGYLYEENAVKDGGDGR